MVKKMNLKKLALVVLMLTVGANLSLVFAREKNDDIRIVVSSDGMSKVEATNTALRSAIEQVLGTFVSSNTTILNDELVRDEIVTVSSGNIKSFEYLSEIEKKGRYYVTLEAIVSIGKLVSYVQSKGAIADLAGEKFNQDMLMYEFYKNNEKKAIDQLISQVTFLSNNILYDYELNVEEPKLVKEEQIRYLDYRFETAAIKSAELFGKKYDIVSSCNQIYCPAKIKYQSDIPKISELIWVTLASLSMSEDQKKWCDRINMDYDCFAFPKPKKVKNKVLFKKNNGKSESIFFLRNKDVMKQISKSLRNLNPSFTIKCSVFNEQCMPSRISCYYQGSGRDSDHILKSVDDALSSMHYCFLSPWQTIKKSVMVNSFEGGNNVLYSREYNKQSADKGILELINGKRISIWLFNSIDPTMNGFLLFNKDEIGHVSKIEIE